MFRQLLLLFFCLLFLLVHRSFKSLYVWLSSSNMTSWATRLPMSSATCFCWIPLREQNRSSMQMPLDVNCQTDPFIVYTCWYLPSADSMKRASRKRWHMERAISLAMEKVVVVVVGTMRDGSLGSGMRLDWENLRDPRLLIASSDRNVCSTLVKRTRCADNGSRLTTSVEKRSLKSCRAS